MGREVKSKTRGQLWGGRDERSKWDKKLRLHPPVHIRALIVFMAVSCSPSGHFEKEWRKKSAHHFHQIDVGCARLHEMPLYISRICVTASNAVAAQSFLFARGGRTTDGRVLHQKEGGLLGAIKRRPGGPGARFVRQNSSLLEFQLEKCALDREKAKKE